MIVEVCEDKGWGGLIDVVVGRDKMWWGIFEKVVSWYDLNKIF